MGLMNMLGRKMLPMYIIFRYFILNLSGFNLTVLSDLFYFH